MVGGTERDNALRWDGTSRGFYEVYYFKFNDPEQGIAFWFRYTLLIPIRGRGEGVGELWAIFFDATMPENNRAWKRTYPIDQVSSQREPFKFQIHDSVLQHDAAKGRIEGTDDTITWDLRVDPDPVGLRNLPSLLYKLPFPTTKVVAPNLTCTYSGTVSFGDRVIEVNDAPGHQAHIWGTKHAAQWAWANCNLFDGGKDVVLEALSAQVKVGPLLAPPVSSIFLRVGEDEYRFDGFRQMLAIRSTWDVENWSLEARSRQYQLLVQVTSRPAWMVGVRYQDPDGETRVCNNTKVANAEVRVLERCRGAAPRLIHALRAERTCAFEVVGPEAVPGIPVRI